jgi:DNA primase
MKIKEYLNEIDIEYSESGEKNVTEGHVNIRCPFCEQDPSRHLGIDLTSGVFHCWICDETGNMVKLAKALEGISWSSAKKRVESFDKTQVIEGDIVETVNSLIDTTKKEEVKFEWISLPKESIKINKKSKYTILQKFLQDRKITMDMCYKYDLHYCKKGKYRDRIVIPIYSTNGDLLGFTSRDMTGKSKLKYVHPRGFPIKNYLYNLDLFNGKTLILVEGCIDAMRVGEGAVALFNSEMSIAQERTIREMHRKDLFDEIVVALDSDAYLKGVDIGHKLEGYRVKVLQLPIGKDPADLGREKIFELVKKSS